MSKQADASPVPFALLSNGRLADVSGFESGVLEDGKCPGCGGTLVAKKGEQRTHHFAHYSLTNCVGALETSLHLAAKQVLIDAVAAGKSFFAPAFVNSYFPNRKFPAIDLPLLSVECEKTVFLQDQHRRPDAVAEWALGKLAIEICVTNPLDEERKFFYESAGLNCVEIDLGGLEKKFKKTKQLILEEVVDAVLRGRDIKTWGCRVEFIAALIQEEPELLNALKWTPSFHQSLVDPPTQTFSVPVAESIKVDGKFVRLKRLPSGDLSISVDKSETMLRKVIEPLARASGSGWYDYDHQNWLVPVRNAAGARQKLIALSQRNH